MPIDTTRKSINPATTISMMTIHDWPAMVFGLPFMGIGAYIVGISLGMIPCDPAKIHAPRHVLTAAGGLFLVAGLWVFSYGLITFFQRLEKQQLEKNWPTEIWRVDYRWDPQGINDQALANVGRGLFSTALGVGLIGPMNWIIFALKQIPLFAKIGILIFDAWIVGILIGSIYRFLQWGKYKTSRLQFQGFPFFLGDKMEVLLCSGSSLRDVKHLTVTLRCVEEKYETRGSGKNQSQVVVAYQVYAETLEFFDLQSYNQETLRLPLKFILPLEAGLETRLRDRPAVYWELVVKAAIPGIDYAANFLVPIYKK